MENPRPEKVAVVTEVKAPRQQPQRQTKAQRTKKKKR